MEIHHLESATKHLRTKDRVFELPDDIIPKIISLLTLKEAVRTSTLSKSWQFLWTCHPYLFLDYESILEGQAYSDGSCCFQPVLNRQKQTCKFLKLVDHIMDQRNNGPKVDSLAIYFPLGSDSASYINKWITSVVAKGVENIFLDLSQRFSSRERNGSLPASKLYKFSFELLNTHVSKCTVKNLRLTSCCLSSLPTSKGVLSLVSLELQSVDITDKQLKDLLPVCLSLERLSLDVCSKLVNFKCGGGHGFHLKHLRVRNCFRLAKFEVNTSNLSCLEYTGQFVRFFFKNVPRLTEIFFSFTGSNRGDGVSHALTKFAYDLPQLKRLNLISVRSMEKIKLPERIAPFTSIKQLVLTIFPFNDNDKLFWISHILKAFPLLHKLELNLFSPSYIRLLLPESERHIPSCPQEHLNELEINGFYGNHHEVDLLKYLVNNLVGLEVLTVSPRQKQYKGLCHWEYEVTSNFWEIKMKSINSWLQTILPPTVRLVIQ